MPVQDLLQKDIRELESPNDVSFSIKKQSLAYSIYTILFRDGSA